MKALLTNLFFLFSLEILLTVRLFAQPVPYGYNDDVGQYIDVGNNTQLYYEIYGSGDPLLMLHGGVYGYIDEFSGLIPKLSEKYQVICLGTRGHVKSDIGHAPFTYDQRASDAHQLIKHLGLSNVSVVGFSDGGMSAYKLAANYPEVVAQMIVIGAGDLPIKRIDTGPMRYSAESLMQASAEYFEHRLNHMPEPDRWNESLSMITDMYNNSIISKETFTKITCPVLLIAGEKDEYFSQQSLQKAHEYIPDAHLEVIQGCGHVVFFCNFQEVWKLTTEFLKLDVAKG
ncbi:MAG: alpha/beta hydrolase [Cyclobacteriaceae bacterium]